jgi:hypothetical protein
MVLFTFGVDGVVSIHFSKLKPTPHHVSTQVYKFMPSGSKILKNLTLPRYSKNISN